MVIQGSPRQCGNDAIGHNSGGLPAPSRWHRFSGPRAFRATFISMQWASRAPLIVCSCMHQGTWLQLVCMHSLRNGAGTHAVAFPESTAHISAVAGTHEWNSQTSLHNLFPPTHFRERPCLVLAPSMAQCVWFPSPTHQWPHHEWW